MQTFQYPNLLVGTRDWSGSWGNAYAWSADGTRDGFVVMSRAHAWAGLYKPMKLVVGQTYTFSACVRVEPGQNHYADISVAISQTVKDDYLATSEIDVAWKRFKDVADGEWHTISLTFTPKASKQAWARVESINDYKLSVCAYMLVEGDTPAAWAPADGETLAGWGALVSANLLDGLTPKLNNGTEAESDGTWHHAARTQTDMHDDWLVWDLPGQTALEANQTYHVGLSARGESVNAASLHISIGYEDAAGNHNWATSDSLAIGTSWGRDEATITVPSGMKPFAFYVSAWGTCPETWMSAPTLSLGSPVTLASSAHTPYATQEHIVEIYATKASLEVTNNSIKSEVSERITLANIVSSVSSSLNQTDQNVSNLQSGLATTNSNLATTNSNLDTANTNISNLENSIANTNKKVQTNTSNISQLSSSIVSAVKGESTYTDPYGNTVTNTLASKIEQTSTNLTLKFNNYTATSDMNDAIATAKSEATSAANSNTASKLVDYTKTNDLASTAAVKDAKKAGTDAAIAASAAQNTASDAQSKANNLMTMIRASETGIEVGKSNDGTTFTTTRTRIDEDSFDILDKNGNVLNTFEKTGQTLYVEGVDNFSVRSDPNYQTYVYTDACRFTIDSKNRVITYGVYDIDLTLAENAILGMYVYTESGMDTEDLKSRITSTVKETDLPSHTGRPGLTGTIITVSYNPSSSTDKITKYGMNRVALKINSNGKILAFNFGTSNSHVGYGSMTLGYGNLATGSYSTAFGVNTESHGDNSVSMGTGTYAMRSNSLAVGIYNDPRSNTLFSVGNGTDQDNRSNAFWVNDDGNALAASHFTALEGLGTNGTLDVRGHSTLNTLLVANNFSAHSTANISGALTAGSIKTSGSLSSGALTIHGSRKIDGIWEGSKVINSAGQSTAFMSASEFQTITGYSLGTAQTNWALLASNGEWGSSVGRNFTLGWTSNYINVAVNPSTNSQIRVNYTFIKFA